MPPPFQGHFRRAAVLVKQERWQEAVAAYLLCLHLGGNDQSVIKTACQVSQLTTDTLLLPLLSPPPPPPPSSSPFCQMHPIPTP